MNDPNDNTALPYSLREERWSASIHGAGIAAGLVALGFLVPLSTRLNDGWAIASAVIFVLSILVLYTASTLYHAATDPSLKKRLKRFDHIAIYFLIAGTYTPFLLTTLRGTWGWTLFGIVWGLALLGTLLKLYTRPGGTSWWSISLYLTMGWLIVAASGRLFPLLPARGLFLLLLGGAFYTLGVLFYLWKSRPYTHAVWHGFVLAGTLSHLFAVLFSCLLV